MLGKLKKINNVWSVEWMDSNEKNIVHPLHPDSIKKIPVIFSGSPSEEFDIEFYITIDGNINMVTEYAVISSDPVDETGYPLLGVFGKPTWDEIFSTIDVNLNIDLPIRLKNWLKNNFHTPIKK